MLGSTAKSQNVIAYLLILVALAALLPPHQYLLSSPTATTALAATTSICGHATTATARAGGSSVNVLVPADGTAVLQWASHLGGVDADFRVLDAQISALNPPFDSQQYGLIQNQIASWSSYEHIETQSSINKCGVTVAVSPVSGPPGTVMTVVGSGWPYPGDAIDSCIWACGSTIQVDNDGSFSASFTVPADAPIGQNTLTFDSTIAPAHYAVNFYSFTVTQSTATACLSDGFTAPALAAGWNWVDPLNNSSYSLTANPGALRLQTASGSHDIHPGLSNTNAPRVGQYIDGDFDVSTKVTIAPTQTYQSAGLLVWFDSGNFFWFGRAVGGVVQGLYYRNGADVTAPNGTFSAPNTTVYLRMTRNANGFLVYYSLDGTNWTQAGAIDYPAAAARAFVGMYLINQWQDNQISADFDYFNCTGNASSSAAEPLIFIPGISGSSLDEVGGVIGIANLNLWLGLPGLHNHLILDPDNPSPPNIIAPDAIREIPGSPVYKTILDRLQRLVEQGGGGYKEYQGNDFQQLTPYERCLQSGSDVNLFVFSYDWRKSNAENAILLKNLVRCIRAIHPNTKVNILTHSMGGLVARRYILDNNDLDNLGEHKHYVDKLITIAAPWLGAPKAISVLETGQFDIPQVLVLERTIAKIAQYAPGAQELLPSQSYFNLVGSPFSEMGWDINNDCHSLYDYYNGCQNENYDYSMLASMLNKRYPRDKPGKREAGFINRDFHNHSGQDDWSQDQSGVHYYHIYGVLSHAATAGHINAKIGASCNIICSPQQMFDVAMIAGDGTVPIDSALRMGNGKDLNAPGAVIVRCSNPTPKDLAKEELLKHKDLVRNPEIIDYVLSILQSTPPQLHDCTFARGGNLYSAKQSQAQTVSTLLSEPPAQPAYYLRVTGAVSVAVADAFGNTTQPTNGSFGTIPPGISYDLLGSGAYLIEMPAEQAYTITIQSGLTPMNIALTVGNDTVTTQATRYLDVALPTNVKAMLKITSQGAEQLRYDADGDGSFETPVVPTAAVSGAQANDTDPPALSMSRSGPLDKTTITLSAADTGAGVKELFYSLDDLTYQPYTGPIQINTLRNPVLYAFADDKVANRSGTYTYKLTNIAYFPLARRR